MLYWDYLFILGTIFLYLVEYHIDELPNSCSPTIGKKSFTAFINLPHVDFLIFSVGLTSSSNRPSKKRKMAKEKNIASSSFLKKPKLSKDVRNSSNL